MIEALAEEHRADRFVPNDLFMNDTTDQILIVTGPNMGGKSTFLRQNALLVIMAQMGSFVPADLLRFPIVDRIFTRIGASDNLARGRSTFMVEMTETAIILNSATPRSLIILDEIGRGTATFDGLSIAWAVIEHIQSNIRAKTIFATHYHELTELADLLPGIKNYHVAVKEAHNRIIFLRTVEAGAADRSYGIEVAKLAGIPGGVTQRAREILKKHEENEHQLSDNLTVRAGRKPRIVVNQLSLFTALEEELRNSLRSIDLDNLTPLEALRLLAELKKKAGMKDIRRFTLEEKVGQLFFLGFQGPAPDAEASALIDRIRPGGFTFFQRNIEGFDQFHALTDTLREPNGIPAFLAIDHEGGRVDRLKHIFGAIPSMGELASLGTAYLRAGARIIAAELEATGLNLDFAPVLDLRVDGAVVADRALGEGPAEVSRLAGAFIDELSKKTIIACGKHFPGLGSSRLDTHFVLPRIDRTKRQLQLDDVLPFQNLIGDLGMIMVAHAHYPGLGDERPAAGFSFVARYRWIAAHAASALKAS